MGRLLGGFWTADFRRIFGVAKREDEQVWGGIGAALGRHWGDVGGYRGGCFIINKPIDPTRPGPLLKTRGGRIVFASRHPPRRLEASRLGGLKLL